jgi:hypothetical protein
VTSSVQNLQYSGFNDQASSAIIRGGRWQICTDAYFRGRCVTLDPGNYGSLGAMGLNDRISSVREVGWGGGGAPGGGGGGGGSAGPIGPGGPALVLYSGRNLTGQTFALSTPLFNFDQSGFNDRAESAEVRDGTWQLCSDAQFQGTCIELGPGRHPNLGQLSGHVSSARIIGSGSGGGGGGGGQGGGGWGGGHSRVILYEAPNFGGRSYALPNNYIANFAGTGFNDRTSSLRVERGYWMFCSDANFQGECRTVGPGRLRDAAVRSQQPDFVCAADQRRVSVQLTAELEVARIKWSSPGRAKRYPGPGFHCVQPGLRDSSSPA